MKLSRHAAFAQRRAFIWCHGEKRRRSSEHGVGGSSSRPATPARGAGSGPAASPCRRDWGTDLEMHFASLAIISCSVTMRYTLTSSRQCPPSPSWVRGAVFPTDTAVQAPIPNPVPAPAGTEPSCWHCPRWPSAQRGEAQQQRCLCWQEAFLISSRSHF